MKKSKNKFSDKKNFSGMVNVLFTHIKINHRQGHIKTTIKEIPITIKEEITITFIQKDVLTKIFHISTVMILNNIKTETEAEINTSKRDIILNKDNLIVAETIMVKTITSLFTEMTSSKKLSIITLNVETKSQ